MVTSFSAPVEARAFSEQLGVPSRESIHEVRTSSFPTLLLALPSQRIIAASPSAVELLASRTAAVLGHTFEEFTVDPPSDGLERFAEGRVGGTEAVRVLRRPDGTDLAVHVRFSRFEHQPPGRFVLVVMAPDTAPDSIVRSDRSRVDAPIVGMADPDLLVERISSDAETLFACSVEDLIGRPLTSLVAEHDVPDCLVALDEAAASQQGMSLYLDLCAVGVEHPPRLVPLRCEMLILPLIPSPSCAFVLLPSPESMSRTHVAADLASMLVRMGRGAAIAELAPRLSNGLSGSTGRTVAGLNRLTARELDLLTRLLQGDRVPAIAVELFVTQSTVRSHLASIFHKVGVTSQQELLNLFRGPRRVQRLTGRAAALPRRMGRHRTSIMTLPIAFAATAACACAVCSSG